MRDYRQSYREMSDGELLNVATQIASLVPEAQDALRAELQKRQISQLDIKQYQEDRTRESVAVRPSKPVVSTYRGTGTKVYGKRDFAPDGSYLTTRWVVMSLIPLIPLLSLRVRRLDSWSFGENWNDSHQVLAQSKPVLRQVLFVYAYVFALAATLYMLKSDPTRALIAICLLVPLPFVLRRYARANMALTEVARAANSETPQSPESPR